MATLRLRRSWMRWRRRRTEKRFEKEQGRLNLLLELEVLQRRRLASLEKELHPLLVSPPPPPQVPQQVVQMLTPGSPPLPPVMEPEPEIPEPEPEMPDPALEIAQRLGPPPQRTSSPSSVN